jgi:ceramide glucosyltransferase
MGVTVTILTFFVLAALGLHLLSVTLVSLRLARARRADTRAGQPPVSLLRPLCGLEYALEETLTSSFTLDYARRVTTGS